ncbi:hypothetical protein CLF_100974 [Clonorchis sinensis]|uniref:Integrase catalytic domain-containing protein n=1 Tax=Clonorchis sinensis TaxID=79923 RepID=G7Y4P0_CLOSI|nr:hypothetical protein CLF_100974 [Clonorchis sinensis]
MVRGATARDPLLQKVLHFHRTHWPAVCSDKQLQPFYQRRSSLSEVDGCLLFAERVIELENDVLKQFHFGHPGINRMKALTRSYVYWPNMDKQLEELVRMCSKCQLSAKSPRKTELCSWPVPETPWSRLHVDFAGPINGQQYLILVDAYSKWPEVFNMDHITACATISKLKHVFSRFGVPNIIVSDNGSAFTSAKFSDFCQENSIQHVRSPPFHPQSNGQVERFVDTFKRALLKLKGEGTTPEIIETFLLSYRATPNVNAPHGKSPAEVLMNRKIRLPVDVIRPTPHSPTGRNINMEVQFNRHHGAVSNIFIPGQSVLAKDYRGGAEKWTQGIIVHRAGRVVYEVNVGSSIWVRHANQLRASYLPATATLDLVLPLEILHFSLTDILLDC